MPIFDSLTPRLESLAAQSLLRSRRVLSQVTGGHAVVDGKTFLAFASNDYLGLAQDSHLIAVAQAAAKRWGVGAGASHLVSGHHAPHDDLEARLAAFVGMPAALGFSCGYMANIAVMPALLGREDAIFADKLNHASLVDGALLSRAKLNRYPHGDMAALASALANSDARHKMIVSDSVFSMDGDIAPLAELLALAEQFDAWLLLDDAHGFGVLGPQGRGALAEAGLQSASERIIYMATLGKAAGVAGAFVAGSQRLIDWLINSARPAIFTTANPPMQAETVIAAIDLIEQADASRAHLQSLIDHLRTGVKDLRWPLLDSRSAIQPLIVGENADCLAASRALMDRGIWVPAIRPPTVPAGSARLRISLSAAHSHADLDQLIAALHAISNASE